MASFSVGDVRPASEHDVSVFRNLMDDDSQWKKVFSKKDTVVYTKHTEASSVQMVKVKTQVTGLSAEALYDTLMDPDYRRAWDKYMIEGYDLCLVSPNTDIGYYLVKCFPPLKNRDSVTLRSWFTFDEEYVIMNHSVFHAAAPPKKEYVRAISYLSGYIVRKTGTDSCFFGFVTQSDPRGKFPSWAVNRIAQMIAPKTVSQLVKAARSYPEWKSKNSPTVKPWIHPEQNKLPFLNDTDVLAVPDIDLAFVDEEEQQEVPEDMSCLIDSIDSAQSSTVGDDDEVNGCDKVETAGNGKAVVEGPQVEENIIVPQSKPNPAKQSISIG